MKNRLWPVVVLFLSVVVFTEEYFPFENRVPEYNRLTSRVVARHLSTATPANLDVAAYYANPMRFDPAKQRYKKPSDPVKLSSLTFGGTLDKVCNTLSETPLTDKEKKHPMAWKPLAEEHLWKEVKEPGFGQISTKITGEKWADPNVVKPYQTIALVWLHREEERIELWVKVEFQRWVTFLSDVNDHDNDGIKEVYGRVSHSHIPEEKFRQAIEWIENEYQAKTLTRDEIVDWANILASYWYPTLNTDIVDMGESTSWPLERTERKIQKSMKGVVIDDPVAVIRGNPFGTVLYNVFSVAGIKKQQKEEKEASDSDAETNTALFDTQTPAQFIADNAGQFERELQPYGTYEKWAEHNKEVLGAIRHILDSIPEERMGIQGGGDWIFFRKALEYMVAGDLSNQPEKTNPIPHLRVLKSYCDIHGVNLLFVPIPAKAEVYCDKLVPDVWKNTNAIVNPWLRKFLNDAQEAGIEVIDVLPAMLEAKKQDSENKEHLYQHQDTHWTNRGLQVVASLIAERIKKYTWYDALEDRLVSYSIQETKFDRVGDIVDKMPDNLKTNYTAVSLYAEQVVTPDGKLFQGRGAKDAPIMLMGDSYTGVYELIDCKSAGVGAHCAAKSSLPVDIITSWGGGPLVRNKMIRARGNALGTKRLIVYLMTARDLYDYSQTWEPLETK